MPRWYTDKTGKPKTDGTKWYKDNKYHAKKTEVDGIKFDSRAEANYYMDLKLLQKAGEIVRIELQPEYELIPPFTYQGKKYRAIKYRADFLAEYEDGHIEVVDVKGKATRTYQIKKKLLLYRYPDIYFVEVRR